MSNALKSLPKKLLLMLANKVALQVALHAEKE
jgi:hypothetical protein